MKILHIISSLKIGGAERSLCNLLAKLQGAEFEHHVAYFHPGPVVNDIQALGIRTYQIKGLVYRYDPYAYVQLNRLIKIISPDVIHSSLWAANIMARLLGRQLGIPVVCALHGNCQHEGALRNYLDRHTAHLSHTTIAVAQSVAAAYAQTIRGANKQLVTIPNGIDANQLRARAAANPLTRVQLGIPTNAFVIGSVGRLEPIKSYAVLVRAFSLFLQQIPQDQRPMVLCLVGDGSQLPTLQALAQELGIAPQVIFTGARTDAYRFYPLFDCFALSSQSEGLSIALLEALSFGLPVVTTNQQPRHEVIEHGINGFIVPPNDAGGLATAFAQLYKSQELVQKINTVNRTLVAQHFDINTQASRYKEVFSSTRQSPN